MLAVRRLKPPGGATVARLAGLLVLLAVGYQQWLTADRGDLHGFHMAWSGGLYDIPWHFSGAFVYSPWAGVAIWPLSFLPFPLLNALWLAAQLAALAWLVGLPLAAVLAVFFQPVVRDLESGNIHLFLTVAVVLAVRHPQAWAFVALTKVTPAVGAAYHLGAREWRHAVVAAGVTIALVILGFVLMPDLWLEWMDLLTDSTDAPPHPADRLTIPVLYRLPVALGIALLAGWRGWRWAVPFAAVLAMPSVWLSSITILLASWRLLRAGDLSVVLGPAAATSDAPAEVRRGDDGPPAPASDGLRPPASGPG